MTCNRQTDILKFHIFAGEVYCKKSVKWSKDHFGRHDVL